MQDNTNQYQNQLENTNKTFNIILQEYYQNFPLFKLNQDNTFIFNELSSDKANLKVNQTNIFELKNNIQKQIDDINKDMRLKNKQINEIKSINDKLEKELFNLKNGNHAAVEQLDDINTNFYDNITFSLGLLGIGSYLAYITYSKYKSEL
jgi:hypothetical protein